MSEVNGSPAGTRLPADGLSIDFAFSEWIYQRSGIDQGLSLSEIVGESESKQETKLFLDGIGLIMAENDFIYNPSDVFAAAVVKAEGTYKIVFRGTNIGKPTGSISATLRTTVR